MPVIPDLIESLRKIEELHKKKNDDYANSSNPFFNFDHSALGLSLFKNPQDQAYVWPIYTKLARLSNILNRKEPAINESVEDSLLDIATYVLLWKADLKRRR